ncbi:MAG: phosphoenolpyruvate carboxykinase [candidate division WS1 bacterium]|nr:phosphoenolpyruvate carboxykinase [candidate division WS1 bacterium]
MLQLAGEVTDQGVIIYMTGALCTQPAQVLQSEQAARIIQGYLDNLDKRQSERLALLRGRDITPVEDAPSPAARELARLLGLLVDLGPEEIRTRAPDVGGLLSNLQGLAELVEELYDHWRHYERYLIFEGGADDSRDRAVEGHLPFIENNEYLTDLVRTAYRQIEHHLRGHWPRVYRQVPAGTNMSLLLDEVRWPCPGGSYETLRDIRMVRLALLVLPVILNPRRNFRQGKIVEMDHNPLDGTQLDPKQWFCLPLRVGELSFQVYFHREYLALGVSLVNLFELSGHVEARCKPDGILVFGLPDQALDGEMTAFFVDEKEDVAVGGVRRCEDVEYFGYFKKMILTLHNVIMMRRGRLPVHGAMCRVNLRGGPSVGLVLVGDSGAGKSETLDAFQSLAEDWISDLTIIFDDMGSLALSEDGLIGYGTETGAFVRLDDLDPSYAFGHLDRSILMSPHRQNARVVIPLTEYKDVVAGCPVDLLLYANNYEPVDEELPAVELFDNPEQALHIFRSGYRAAKGTTDEQGLVRSYFANPFGPSQMRELHEGIAQRYFEEIYRLGVPVGQLRTRLGIAGWEREGPRAAAEALLSRLQSQAGA